MSAELKVVCISNMPYITGEDFVTDKTLVNLTLGKHYRATIARRGWYRVWDDYNEDYLYPPHMFEVVSHH